jgi:hypothetical protein
MEIKIEPMEFFHAVDTARSRMMVSMAMRMNAATTYERSLNQRMNEEVIGAVGEIAIAKTLNAFHIGSVNTFHRVPDCIADTEVRSTPLENGSLIIRDNDANDRYYVLVVGEAPKVRIVGWILGEDAKQDKWIRNPHGHRKAWFVPQEALFAWEMRLNQIKREAQLKSSAPIIQEYE